MLVIEVPLEESFDEERMEFLTTSAYRLELEHSLASLSKWESKFEKPFLSADEKTAEESLWYIQAMTLTPNVPPEIFAKLSQENITEITEYINGKQTATWFREDPNKPKNRNEIITAEVIYYWMLSLNISKDCEDWHLNRLITLIRTTSEKNAPPKKKGRVDHAEMARQRNAVNQRRLAEAAAKREGGSS